MHETVSHPDYLVPWDFEMLLFLFHSLVPMLKRVQNGVCYKMSPKHLSWWVDRILQAVKLLARCTRHPADSHGSILVGKRFRYKDLVQN